MPSSRPPAAARSANMYFAGRGRHLLHPHRAAAVTSPVWHPFTQHGLEEPIPLVERAEGAALYTADGRRIIDAISSWWVTTHGHSHPRIVAAIAEQAARLDQLI